MAQTSRTPSACRLLTRSSPPVISPIYPTSNREFGPASTPAHKCTIHRVWQRHAIRRSEVRAGVAAGLGDHLFHLLRRLVQRAVHDRDRGPPMARVRHEPGARVPGFVYAAAAAAGVSPREV